MKALLLAAPMIMLALAGCSRDGGDDGYTVPATDAEGRYIVTMTSALTFEPKFAKVPAGATVVWMNEGGRHNTASEDGLWSSDVTSASEDPVNFERVFDETGDFGYQCDPHKASGMTGIIRVVDGL